MMLYQGKIKELIEQKIEEGGLTDALVALAPSVSPRLWQSACSAYARQLRVGRQFTKAANYLLVGRDVEKAVEVSISMHTGFPEDFFFSSGFMRRRSVSRCALLGASPTRGK